MVFCLVGSSMNEFLFTQSFFPKLKIFLSSIYDSMSAFIYGLFIFLCFALILIFANFGQEIFVCWLFNKLEEKIKDRPLYTYISFVSMAAEELNQGGHFFNLSWVCFYLYLHVFYVSWFFVSFT